ncbi:MAG: DJ-1/PfpI family protein [Opitutaceae bacterium]|nr:DJ-1/PfpI family protein [Opitutaceae bacterium]
MPTTLTLLADGFEEIETVAPVDLLRRSGVDVTIASLADNRYATGRSGITMMADTALKDVRSNLYDMIFIPGGQGVKHLRADPRVGEMLLHHHQAGRWLAAICAAPTVLYDAGLLEGRRYTAHFSVANELGSILANERIVTDGKITTSRGAGTAVEFGLHLIALLVSPAKAEEISKAICF